MAKISGIVRGFQAEAGSRLGMVILEVDPAVELPRSLALQELGPLTRPEDSLQIHRAVGVVGEAQPCIDLAESYLDRAVTVTFGRYGLAWIWPEGGGRAAGAVGNSKGSAGDPSRAFSPVPNAFEHSTTRERGDPR